MRSTLLLNYDILCELAYWSDEGTCAILMLTCRAMRTAAAKAVLRRPCRLSEAKDVHRFLCCLQVDPSCFQHVRELWISFETLPQEMSGRFLNGLQHLKRLETLVLSDGDDSLTALPGLLDTIAQLITIRKLEVRYAGDVTCRLLSKMQASLTHISLDWLQEDCDFFYSNFPSSSRYPQWPNYHPVPLLSKWRTTLEELECASWFNCPGGLPRYTQIYPKLRRLSIERDDNPRIAPYIHAYPNLTHLCVLSEYDQLWNYSGTALVDGIRLLRIRHATNVRSQEGPDGANTWPQLQQFEGTLVDLYLLGITCCILRVSLCFSVNPRDLELLPPALPYAQPQHLKVHGTGMLLAHPRYGLTKLLREPCAARLESLVLGLDFKETEGLDVVTALVSIPLSAVCITVFIALDRTTSRTRSSAFRSAVCVSASTAPTLIYQSQDRTPTTPEHGCARSLCRRCARSLHQALPSRRHSGASISMRMCKALRTRSRPWRMSSCALWASRTTHSTTEPGRRRL